MPIRTTEPRDWAEIIAIYNHAIDTRIATAHLERVSVEGRRPWFEEHGNPRHPIYVDEVAGTIRGWCSVSAYRPGRDALVKTAELSYYVHPDFRREGVASGLISHAIAGCREGGFNNVFAVLLGVNQQSVALLLKLGFTQWGCLPGVAEIDGKEIDHLYFGKKI
jgi:phosphinothricin acetyltransferase